MGGIPKLDGAERAEKREDFRARFDYLRPLLLHEPRGHALPWSGWCRFASTIADYGAFFISSYVYLDMCGHGTIGYARSRSRQQDRSRRAR